MCQILNLDLTSVAAIVEEGKSFSVERIATRSKGRIRTSPPRRRWRHPPASTRQRQQRSGFGLLQTSAELWSQVGGRDPLSTSLDFCPVVQVCLIHVAAFSPPQKRTPATGAWRAEPLLLWKQDLRTFTSSWWTLDSGNRVQPAWRFSCVRRNACKNWKTGAQKQAFQGSSQLQRRLLRIPETDTAIGSLAPSKTRGKDVCGLVSFKFDDTRRRGACSHRPRSLLLPGRQCHCFLGTVRKPSRRGSNGCSFASKGRRAFSFG